MITHLPVFQSHAVAPVCINAYSDISGYAYILLPVTHTISIWNDAAIKQSVLSGSGYRFANDSLLSEEIRVCIRRVTDHAIVKHIVRVRDSVAPEWRRLNAEVLDDTSLNLVESQRDWTAVSVFSCVALKILPPRLYSPTTFILVRSAIRQQDTNLSIAVNPSYIMSIDFEVFAGNDEPGRLILTRTGIKF